MVASIGVQKPYSFRFLNEKNNWERDLTIMKNNKKFGSRIWKDQLNSSRHSVGWDSNTLPSNRILKLDCAFVSSIYNNETIGLFNGIGFQWNWISMQFLHFPIHCEAERRSRSSGRPELYPPFILEVPISLQIQLGVLHTKDLVYCIRALLKTQCLLIGYMAIQSNLFASQSTQHKNGDACSGYNDVTPTTAPLGRMLISLQSYKLNIEVGKETRYDLGPCCTQETRKLANHLVWWHSGTSVRLPQRCSVGASAFAFHSW